MGRRRNNSRRDEDLIKGIFGLVMLLGLGWIISPQFRVLVSAVLGLIMIVAGIGLFVLLVYVLYRVLTRASRSVAQPALAYSQSPAHPQSVREHAPRYGMSVTMLDPVEEPGRYTVEEVREKLRAIDWYQFEKLTELIFKDLGYKVDRRGGAHADGGIDLVIEKDGQKLGVQCKHWKTWNVRPKEVREFVGALHIAELKSGYYVTLQGCTEAAGELANERMIQFVDETNVINSIRMRDGQVKPEMLRLLNDKTKHCPKCESVMVWKTPAYGEKWQPFWGCPRYPRCKGKI